MRNMDELTVAEVCEIATTFARLAPKTSQAVPSEPDMRIVILQRGWVVVGKYRQEGTNVTIASAQIIRRWGTTRGLGELASEGPKPDTVLDPAGTVRCHALTVIATLDCEAEAWPN